MNAPMLEQRIERLIAEFRVASEKVEKFNFEYHRKNLIEHDYSIKTPQFSTLEYSGRLEQTGSSPIKYEHKVSHQPSPEEEGAAQRERAYCISAGEALNQIIALKNCRSGDTREGYNALVTAIRQFRNTYEKGTEGYKSQVKLDFSISMKKATEELQSMKNMAEAYSVSSVNLNIRNQAKNALSFIENVLSENNDILYHGILSMSKYSGNIRAEAIAMDYYMQNVPDVDIQFEKKKAPAAKAAPEKKKHMPESRYNNSIFPDDERDAENFDNNYRYEPPESVKILLRESRQLGWNLAIERIKEKIKIFG
jgi:hypothetical protein